MTLLSLLPFLPRLSFLQSSYLFFPKPPNLPLPLLFLRLLILPRLSFPKPPCPSQSPPIPSSYSASTVLSHLLIFVLSQASLTFPFLSYPSFFLFCLDCLFPSLPSLPMPLLSLLHILSRVSFLLSSYSSFPKPP